jgi:SAM-dependent methyltransferase
MGDSSFYEQLEQKPWYYMDWKWEYGKALSLIHDGDKILEVGCAEGSFLKMAARKGARVVGLEINEQATRKAKKKGLVVLNQSLEKYSIKHANEYDIVCSFQVLEHIAAVDKFIKDSLKLLKKGGKLIISVPNNDSFIFKDNEIILNFPPHHMGLWNNYSLINLQNTFIMKLIDLCDEPLQKYHQGYLGIYLKNLYGRNEKYLIKLMSPLLNKLVELITPRLAERLSDYLIGHSVMAVYKKI